MFGTRGSMLLILSKIFARHATHERQCRSHTRGVPKRGLLGVIIRVNRTDDYIGNHV